MTETKKKEKKSTDGLSEITSSFSDRLKPCVSGQARRKKVLEPINSKKGKLATVVGRNEIPLSSSKSSASTSPTSLQSSGSTSLSQSCTETFMKECLVSDPESTPSAPLSTRCETSTSITVSSDITPAKHDTQVSVSVAPPQLRARVTTGADGQLRIQRNALGETVCVECRSSLLEHDILLCDSCNDEYHKRCLSPKLATVPTGEWYCPECLAEKVWQTDTIDTFFSSVSNNESCVAQSFSPAKSSTTRQTTPSSDATVSNSTCSTIEAAIAVDSVLHDILHTIPCAEMTVANIKSILIQATQRNSSLRFMLDQYLQHEQLNTRNTPGHTTNSVEANKTSPAPSSVVNETSNKNMHQRSPNRFRKSAPRACVRANQAEPKSRRSPQPRSPARKRVRN